MATTGSWLCWHIAGGLLPSGRPQPVAMDLLNSVLTLEWAQSWEESSQRLPKGKGTLFSCLKAALWLHWALESWDWGLIGSVTVEQVLDERFDMPFSCVMIYHSWASLCSMQFLHSRHSWSRKRVHPLTSKPMQWLCNDLTLGQSRIHSRMPDNSAWAESSIFWRQELLRLDCSMHSGFLIKLTGTSLGSASFFLTHNRA